MLEQIRDFYYVALAGVLAISVIGSVIGIKIKGDNKLSKHDEELVRVNKRVTHLDEHKQSTAICNILQKEIKDDIKSISGTMQVIQASSTEIQNSVAFIKGKLNHG